ncbi:hypothetical protein AAF712_012505 [Marasmius tenuissimus]|uniref:Uncharacterized protein n=1 Tax=Marasmius tenuissimus TaxID=585030 RepID=A0ABR2ZHM7_9AGAR
MKQLAARDFEDLLQCAIPIFEDLLPEPHNSQILKLLYRAAEWHALAKLRMHTDTTIEELKNLSQELGNLLRSFRNTSSQFNTLELPREAAARAKQQQRRNPNSRASTTRKKRKLNLDTYKFHALADYAPTISMFGPTDGYSTQVGEMCHQQVKRYYRLTNKREAAGQIAQRYRRNAMLGDSSFEDADAMVPELHHQISNRHDHSIQLRPWLYSNPTDPARMDFIRKLKDHLLRRLLQRPFDGDTDEGFTDDQRNSVDILGNKIYEVKTLCINYTTYDVRRDSDLVNSHHENCFIMVNSPVEGDRHPFWYGRILSIFHAQISKKEAGGLISHGTRRMEFLWVRWLGVEPGYRSGRNVARLPKVGFVHEDNEDSFGFLEPQAVIRASHLIPQFSAGRTNELLQTTEATAARPQGEHDDWVNYYVNIFVDRDMLMRYHGGGIGHKDCTTVTVLEDEDDILIDADDETTEESAVELDEVTNGMSTAREMESSLKNGNRSLEMSADDAKEEDAAEDDRPVNVSSDDEATDDDNDDEVDGGDSDSDYGDL